MCYNSIIKKILLIICTIAFSLPLLCGDYHNQVLKYFESQKVKAVFKVLEKQEEELKSHWKAIASIYSPSGNETLRAQYITRAFKRYNIPDAYIDKHGNAVGIINGKKPGPAVVFLGTMDDLATVAELVKNWKKPIKETDGKLIGPGTNIGATCVSILALAKLFTLPGVTFKGKVILVGVVEEETGLTGIKGFLDDHPGEIDYVVDIMAGNGRISYGAVGIHWFKIHFKGPKGHTLRGGLPNVTRGVARTVDRVFAIPLPTEPPGKRSYLNISMLGAGRVYNHKSDDGWFSVDLRSMDNDTLLKIKKQIFAIAKKVAAEEQLQWEVEPFSESPAGQIPGARHSALVRIGEEAMKLLGAKVSLTDRGSSNMNVAIGRQIPSINIGGRRGEGRNTNAEYANIAPVFDGIKVNFLIGYILLDGKK